MPCEVNCLETSSCGLLRTPPDDAAVWTPFVTITFAGGTITVGNEASPPNNHGYIKSFEYGLSEGVGFKAEIVDEEGGTFSSFVDSLNKRILLAANEVQNCTADWGWIYTDCNNNLHTIKVSDFLGGKTLTFLPLSCETVMDGGKMRFTVTATNLGDRLIETRVFKVYRAHLKQAIRQLFLDNNPAIEVAFIDIDGNEWNFSNEDGGPEGPFSAWTCDDQNALSIARKWITPLMTENKKGILIRYDPIGPRIVFLEDPTQTENQNCCAKNIGTYIYGGDCTNVLSFTPKYQWTLALNSGKGGQAGGPFRAGGEEAKAEEGIENVGIQTTGVADGNENMWRNPNDIGRKRLDAIAAHDRAAKLYEVGGMIEGELRIQGDPSLALPFGNAALTGSSVSIIVINPFYVKSDQSGCFWLAKPVCHPLLTNKNWMIMGVNHQISTGSYVTTLSVKLIAPNVNVPIGEPLGGTGCGGQSFENG
jgi:hypothetical protein